MGQTKLSLMLVCVLAISAGAKSPADALKDYSGLHLKPFEVSFTGVTFMKGIMPVNGETIMVEPGDVLAMVTVGCEHDGLAYFDGILESVLNKTPEAILSLINGYDAKNCRQYKERNIYPVEILKAKTLRHEWLDISFDDAKKLVEGDFRERNFSLAGAIVVGVDNSGKGAKEGFRVGDQIFNLYHTYEPSWFVSLFNGWRMAGKNIELSSLFYDASPRISNRLNLDKDMGIAFLDFETVRDGKYEWSGLTNSVLVVGD